jgi:PEGA domain
VGGAAQIMYACAVIASCSLRLFAAALFLFVASGVSVARAADSSQLRVEDKSGQPVRVFVDGIDRGEAPWEGALAAGDHEVYVRGVGRQSVAVRVRTSPGPASVVIAESLPQTGVVRIVVEGGHGEVRVDGNVCGDGRCATTLPVGVHKLEIVQPGFETFTREFTLSANEMFSLNAQLTLTKTVATDRVQAEVRALHGTYVGVALLGSPVGSSQGSSFDDRGRCANLLSAKSCESSAPMAAGISAVVGYHWEPVGLEAMIAAQYDVSTARVRFEPGVVGANPLATGPARDETFTLRRVGFTAAVRARLSTQNKRFRLGVAAGPGLSVRYAYLLRVATTDDGRRDSWSTEAESPPYVAPALSTEVQLGVRVGDSTALTFSTLLQAEHAAYSDLATARAKAATDRVVVADGKVPAPIATPAYQIASGGQWQLGFAVGVMFGP